MKEKSNKKVFVSANADRGLAVKVSPVEKKVSISFWGDDNPKNISFSKEEAIEICEYIVENVNSSDPRRKDIFEMAFENMKNVLPETHL